MDDPQTQATDAEPAPTGLPPHLEQWKFRPGAVPVHRAKGSVGGRAAALQTLDAMMAQAGNQAKLRKAMQAAFDKRPVWFFLNVMLPTMPRELMIKATANDSRVTWTSLLTQLQPPAGADPAAGPPTIDVEAVTVKPPEPRPADPPPPTG